MKLFPLRFRGSIAILSSWFLCFSPYKRDVLPYIRRGTVMSYGQMKHSLALVDNHLQPFTKYLRQTLVFMRKSALWEKLSFYFSAVFC